MAYRGTKKNSRKGISSKLALVCVVILVIGIVSVASVLLMFAIGPSTTTPTTSTSTFITLDYVSGIDVSDDTNLTILVPVNITEAEDWEETDFYNISNYEILIDSNTTSDIDEDLSTYPAIAILIDAGTHEANYHFYLTGAINKEYTIYVYDLSASVNMIVLEEDLTEFNTTGGFTTDSANLTMVFNSDTWETECLAPILDAEVDTLLERNITDPLTYYTHFSAFIFTFNGTIAEDSVNITISSYSIIVMIDDDTVYLVFFTPIKFSQKPLSFMFEIEVDDSVELSSVAYGRVVIPEGESGTITLDE